MHQDLLIRYDLNAQGTKPCTGKPKGVLHTTGGYMIMAHTTTRYVFDLQPGDTWWCTADPGIAPTLTSGIQEGFITSYKLFTFPPSHNFCATYPQFGQVLAVIKVPSL